MLVQLMVLEIQCTIIREWLEQLPATAIPLPHTHYLLVAFLPSLYTHFFRSMKLCAVRELGFSTRMWLISSTEKFSSLASSATTRHTTIITREKNPFTPNLPNIKKMKLCVAQWVRHGNNTAQLRSFIPIGAMHIKNECTHSKAVWINMSTKWHIVCVRNKNRSQTTHFQHPKRHHNSTEINTQT